MPHTKEEDIIKEVPEDQEVNLEATKAHPVVTQVVQEAAQDNLEDLQEDISQEPNLAEDQVDINQEVEDSEEEVNTVQEAAVSEEVKEAVLDHKAVEAHLEVEAVSRLGDLQLEDLAMEEAKMNNTEESATNNKLLRL
jgi:hypothetical protein